jgi:hypothetical protein
MDSPTRPLLEAQEIPEGVYMESQPTHYIDKSRCGCRIAYFPLGNFAIWGHWKIQPLIPLVVSLTVIAIHIIFVVDTHARFPTLLTLIAANSAAGLSFLSLAVSYILTIVIGPGYVPFNWCKTRLRQYSWEHQMANIVQFSYQVQAARLSVDRPPRSSFSISALRFVLRADHYCSWARSWIGIKNHRFFMLTCFWAAVYAVLNLVGRFFFFRDLFRRFDLLALLGLGTIPLLLFMLCFSGYHFACACRNLGRNATSIEVWRKRTAPCYDKGCIGNYEEVCGPRACIPCWVFPCATCFQPLEDGFYAPRLDADGRPVSLSEMCTLSTADGYN